MQMHRYRARRKDAEPIIPDEICASASFYSHHRYTGVLQQKKKGEGTGMEEKFFYENDVRVTKTAVKVVRWLILAFPLLIILSLVGIFQSDIRKLIPLTVIGLIVTMALLLPIS